MQFTYTYLKNADQNEVVVGHYKGYDVIPTTKEALAKKGERNDYIYLIYDDNNLLYQNGKVFGSVDKNGNVEEFTARRYLLNYEAFKKELKEFREKSSKSAPAAVKEEYKAIEGDVALGLLVDDTLKSARTLTIDSLLEGFNYGL